MVHIEYSLDVNISHGLEFGRVPISGHFEGHHLPHLIYVGT